MNLTPEDKRLITRRTIYGILLVIAAVLQNTPKAFFEPFGLRQLSVVTLVVCIAMTERELHGMILGLIAGLTLDITGGTTGINAIMLTIIGYICGILVHSIIRNNLITVILFSSIALFLFVNIYWLVTVVFAGVHPAATVLLKFYLPSFLYTAILIPVWFYIVRMIYKIFPNDPRRSV